MPTSSQAAASSRRGSAAAPPPRVGTSTAVPPLPTRRPSQALNSAGSRRGSAVPVDLMPTRRDSSIGANSSNPRLRNSSVFEAAAAVALRSSSTPRTLTDFSSREIQEALRVLRRLFGPVVMRVLLRARRRSRWKGGQPPRRYTPESVVAAILATKSRLVDFPQRLLERLADGAQFHSLAPREIIVYANESHVSCGIVVLLHGQLEERRPEPGGGKAKAGAAATRPIRTQTHRLHKATDVLCLMPVLCEDRATSFFATRDREEADVAIIPSRWFWEVAYGMSQASLPTADVMGRVLRDVVVPHRRDILMADYFPTSVVLLRSWMWSLLTASDRVKLCRSMEVRVLSVGEVLFDEGEYCPYIYIVRRGAMTAIVKGEALAVLEPGASVGEESGLFNDKRNCSVVAATVCEVYALHVRHLLHRFLKYPEGGRRIVTAAMERQQRWMEEGRTRDVFGLVSILSGVPCLGHTTDAMREAMARCATVLTLPQGHQLVTAGTPCAFFCVIGRGSVTLKGVVRGASPVAPVEPPASAASPSNGRRVSSAGKGAAPLPSPPPPAPSPEVRCELRSAGDFFGELCLRPHQWPFDVVCESTVCVWLFDREAVLRVLEKDRADAQAVEVCRQGISLFRAQRGEGSIVETCDGVSSPGLSTNSRRFSAGAQRSRVPSADGLPGTPRARSNSGGSRRISGAQAGLGGDGASSGASQTDVMRPRSSVSFVDGAAAAAAGVQWTDEQWTSYAVTRLQDGLRAEEAKGVSTAPTRDLRDVDKAVEKAMKEKVLKLIAVQPDAPLNPADSDISGDSGELQSIIVEQLFLIITERQPRFLRQVNESNVRLVTEEDDAQVVGELNDSLNDISAIHPLLEQFEAPVAVTGVQRLEDISSPPLDDDLIITPRSLATYPTRPSTEVTESGTLRLLGDVLALEASGGATTGWPAPTPSHGRNRRSTSVGGMVDVSGVFGNSIAPRMSLSRSHLVRPPSGVPPSPQHGGSRDDLLSPVASVVMRPTSSSEPRVVPLVRARPTSVDFNQFNSKLSVDRSTSVLDRYVKIEDQNYFDNFVKVMPLQQDEMWAPDEVGTDGDVSAGSMVLLLLHVARCDYLAADVMGRCARPIVKVTLGQRVLVRTSVMENCTAPRWPIDRSSFISFVRRGIDLVFSVCDADDERRVVYQTTLHTASIHENSGVEQRAMSLTELSEAGSPVTVGLNTDGTGRVNKRPRMTATMLAVTAAKYKALRQYLETREEKIFVDAPSGLDSTKLFLQVMAVEGLKHRIEGSVEVSLYNGGTMHTLLDTGRVHPKTRSPAWSGAKSFVKICGEGGIVTFDLQHKGAVVGSTEATVDELIFGGIGLHRLPLLQAQSGNVVMGQLVISVLGGSVGDTVESRDRDWVEHLAVEELQLSHEGFAINPDPFVVVRDGTGVARMRTPLACSAFQATWTMAEASCLLHCPRLSGSTVAYTLEVCDSDEAEVIGRAAVILSDRGLGPEHRHEVPLDPPGRGVVRLRSLCLPVLELPSLAAEAAATRRGSAGSPAGSRARLPPPPPSTSQTLVGDASAHQQLLLLHVSGCTDLPGGASEELQTDAIGTFAIDAHQYLRTSLQEGTTAPRWPFTKATVLLRIPPPPEAGDAAESTEPPHQRHVCRFSVFDGLVDDVSQIGQVAVPLRQLLTSAVHTYPLFPKRRAAADAAASPLVADGEPLAVVRGRTAAERTVGSVQICTMVGRLDGQVETLSEQHLGALVSTVGGTATPARPEPPVTATGLVPYYNPDGLDGAALTRTSLSSGRDVARGATVVLSLSNVCHVLPHAAEKYIHLVVRHGTRTILSAERRLGSTSHTEWGPTEVLTAVACASMPSGEVLVVELTAMDVVEGKDEEEEGNAAGGEALSPVQREAHPRRTTNGSAAVLKVPLGTAQLAMSSLAAVEAGEVEVLTVTLRGPQRTSSASATNGHSVSPRASVDMQGGVPPVVSFCVFGNRV